MENNNEKIILDIGCGSRKKPGSIGLDYSYSNGVDHVLNLENDEFPFADESVDCIYSSHCFEHLSRLENVWREISRVIKTNGTIEIWTPYPHSDDQWLIGHVAGWSPSRWDHLSSSERSFYSKNFLNGGYWKWNEARFNIKPEVIRQLDEINIPHDFAVRHMNNICVEWGCFFSYVKEDPGIHSPQRNISLGGRYSCDKYAKFEKEKISIEEKLNAIKKSKIGKFFSPYYKKIKDKLRR